MSTLLQAPSAPSIGIVGAPYRMAETDNDPRGGVSYAIGGVDLLLRLLLKDVKSGVYLDVGANHPVRYSNTYGFYQDGWRGVAVDGNADFAPLWREVRPRDAFVCALVAEEVKDITFDVFPDPTMSTIDPETSQRYSARFDKSSIRTETRRTTTLLDLCNIHNLREIHLLSIDIEGVELSALQGMNLKFYTPGVICVEIKNISIYDFDRNATVQYLHNFGYRMISKTPLDAIFVMPGKEYLGWIPPSIS